jgi:hypothetical protein
MVPADLAAAAVQVIMAERANVPCGTCHACCRQERVILHPECGDDIASYDTVEAPADTVGVKIYGGGERRMLSHKPNGDCVYLGDGGCTIWERAPAMCQAFDCRRLFLRFTRAERRRFKKVLDTDVMRAGRERLGSLDATQAYGVKS